MSSNRGRDFAEKFRALVLEYGVTLEVNTGYYGDIEGVDFCVDGKRVVESTSWGGWDFDGKGAKFIDTIRKEVKQQQQQEGKHEG